GLGDRPFGEVAAATRARSCWCCVSHSTVPLRRQGPSLLPEAALRAASGLLPSQEYNHPSRSNAARRRSASAAFASWSARAFSTASGLARSVKLGLASRCARLSRSFSAAAAPFVKRVLSA